MNDELLVCALDELYKCGQPSAMRYVAQLLTRRLRHFELDVMIVEQLRYLCLTSLSCPRGNTLALVTASFVKKYIPVDYRKSPQATSMGLAPLVEGMMEVLRQPSPLPQSLLSAASDIVAVHVILTSKHIVEDVDAMEGVFTGRKLSIILSAISALLNWRVPFGPICRSSQRLSLQKAASKYFRWMDAEHNLNALAQMCEFVGTSVTDSVHNVCPSLLETVEQSSLWQSLLAAVSRGEEAAVGPISAVGRLLEAADEASVLLAERSLRAAHMSGSPMIVCQILASLADVASRIVVGEPTGGCAAALSQCMHDVVQFVEQHPHSDDDDEVTIELCTFVVMLANCLTPIQIPAFEDGDDEEDYDTFTAEANEENSMKRAASATLGQFFCWTGTVLLHKLRRYNPATAGRDIMKWWYRCPAEDRDYVLNFDSAPQAVFACVERLHRAGYVVLPNDTASLTLIEASCLLRFDLLQPQMVDLCHRDWWSLDGVDSDAFLLALRRAEEGTSFVGAMSMLQQLIDTERTVNDSDRGMRHAAAVRTKVMEFLTTCLPHQVVDIRVINWLLLMPSDGSDRAAFAVTELITDGRLPPTALALLSPPYSAASGALVHCCAAFLTPSNSSFHAALMHYTQWHIHCSRGNAQSSLDHAQRTQLERRCRSHIGWVFRQLGEPLSTFCTHGVSLSLLASTDSTLLMELCCALLEGRTDAAQLEVEQCAGAALSSGLVEAVAAVVQAAQAGVKAPCDWLFVCSINLLSQADTLFPSLQRRVLLSITAGLRGCERYHCAQWRTLITQLLWLFSCLGEQQVDADDDDSADVESITNELAGLFVHLSPLSLTFDASPIEAFNEVVMHFRRPGVDEVEWRSALRQFRAVVSWAL